MTRSSVKIVCRLKYLRIAVTALSLTACVLLIVLWVRSYGWWDMADAPLFGKRKISAHSVTGRTLIIVTTLRSEERANWSLWSCGAGECFWDLTGRLGGFYFGGTSTHSCVMIPHWFLVFASAVLAAVPWIHWSKRFSLRTLPIAMTMVAVGLGVIIGKS